MNRLLLATLLVACQTTTAANPQGGEGQACYPNGTCNPGLSCFSNLCVNAGGNDASSPDTSTPDASEADAADASTADASDASTFDVHSLSGLVIWLDAAKGITKDGSNKISVWADQSGQGNDAVPGNPAHPVFVASGIHAGPTVHFDAPAAQESLDVGVSAKSVLGAGDVLIEAVATAPVSATGEALLASLTTGSSDSFFLHRLASNGAADFTNYATLSGPQTAFLGVVMNLTNGAPHIFGIHRTGTTVELRADGATDKSDTNAAYADNYSGLALFTGDFVEVVVVKGSVTAADVSALEGYFKTRYGL